MYKSVCPSWYSYGNRVDIRHLVVPQNTDEEKVINIAKEKANYASGASSCKVQLLQKYLMSIEAKKSYVGLTSLQFDGDSIVTTLRDDM